MKTTKKNLNKDLYYIIERLHDKFTGDTKDLYNDLKHICIKNPKNIDTIRALHIYINPNWKKDILINLVNYLDNLLNKYIDKELEEQIKIDSQLETNLMEIQDKRNNLIEEINQNISELRSKGNFKYNEIEYTFQSIIYLENKKKEIQKYRIFINK